MSNWKDIWSGKQVEVSDRTLESLIKADGFDSGFGSFGVENWIVFIENVAKKLDIKDGDSIYEVGCGSGAFLYPFYKDGHIVGGLDYSRSLIEDAKKVMPKMKFDCKEADTLSVNEQYEMLISNSVLHYFPNINYTKRVINLMIDKTKKSIAILDVNDKAKEEIAKSIRIGTMSKEEYEKKYVGLEQLFYDKSWFEEIAKERDMDILIEDQNIESYANSVYRFNVYMFKRC